MIYTSDGGRTWSSKAFPVGRPDVGSVSCSPDGTCVGYSRGGAYGDSGGGKTSFFVVSGNGGKTWSGDKTVPTGAGRVYGWSPTGCAAGGGPGYMVSTVDGGKTWQRQTILGSPGVLGRVAWCSDNGRCVGNAQEADFDPVVLTRATRFSAWEEHHYALPRPLTPSPASAG
jgi:photosystem II stability/assembly factor-like uncharacterized protein